MFGRYDANISTGKRIIGTAFIPAIGKAETIGVYESYWFGRWYARIVHHDLLFPFRLLGTDSIRICIDINHLHCIREVCMDRF